MIIVTRTRRVDWQRIVGNLQKTGMSLQQIADELDVGKATVSGYASEDVGSEPPFWVGAQLLVLWGGHEATG